MEEKETKDEIKKDWYKSKAMWGGITVVAMGVVHYYKTGDLTEAVTTIAMGFSLVGLRMAKTTL